MNEIPYKIRPIFTAVIGGLWYFAINNLSNDRIVSSAIFIFAFVAGLSFINILQRFRMVFNAYIDNLNSMDGDMKVSIKSSPLPSTIVTVQLLLLVATIISFFGAIYASWA
jgi:hypothetical protein